VFRTNRAETTWRRTARTATVFDTLLDIRGEKGESDDALPAYRSGDFITATRVIFRYQIVENCLALEDGRKMCWDPTFPRETNNVQLTTSRFCISPVRINRSPI
jgi:hypothetical protein